MKIPKNRNIQFEKLFVNRTKELSLLEQFTSEPGSCTYVIGEGGIGKTALVNMFVYKNRDKLQENWIRYDANIVRTGNALYEAIKSIQSNGGLFIIDNAGWLSDDSLYKIEKEFSVSKNCSLIISGRKKPVKIKSSTNIIQLTGLDMRAMLEARLAFYPNAPHIDQILNIINGNCLLFNRIMSNPTLALNIANNFFRIEEFAATQRLFDINLSAEIGLHAQEKTTDPLGIILALVLFFISQFSNQHSTDSILDKINEVQIPISKQIDTQSINLFINPHFITNFVHLRSEPIIDSNNILTILAPNQIVDVSKVREGWASVKYKDVHSEKEISGWVHAKYLKPY
ncbi:MAG: SH3 domain-containing protein [Desulfobacterales bacterium]|nr:SH3 domain-containing protein [Desulfobacterales bacterium]